MEDQSFKWDDNRKGKIAMGEVIDKATLLR